MRQRVSRFVGLILKLAVTALVLAVVVRRVGATRMAVIAAHTDPAWLMVALAIAGLQVVAAARRWQILCGFLVNVRPGLWRTIHLTGQSLLFGQLLPSSVGTDMVRAGAFAREGGLVAATRTVVCDRLIGLFVLLVVAVASLPFFAATVGGTVPIAGVAALATAGIAAFAILVLAPRIVSPLPFAGRAVAIASDDFRTALTVREAAPAIIVLSLAIHSLSVALFAALFRALGANVSIFACFALVPSALLAASVPVSLGGWGVREAVTASGFAMIGVDPAAAVTASILYGLTSPVWGLVIEAFGTLVPPDQRGR